MQARGAQDQLPLQGCLPFECTPAHLQQPPAPAARRPHLLPARNPARSYNRIRGLLNMVLEELPDCPLYYSLHDISTTVKATPMKMDIFRYIDGT